ncbi:MAG: DNA-directed RNA polymerase specialized sigma24 family protein, partial [Vicingaceae bacterium]
MKKPLSANFSDIASIALVQKSLAGDKNALNQLIEIHEPFIYNIAWKYTNNPEEAKDLTQEVLIRVFTKL